MISLPNITLVAVTGKNIPEHESAMRKSMEGIEFHKALLLSSNPNEGIVWNAEFPQKFFQKKRIDPFPTIDDWNKFIVYELGKYIDTEFALLIHADGYVIHPELWNPDWLKYDYAGSPWPLPTDYHSYRDINGKIQRVGNSVGLRSRKLMKLPTELKMPWRSYYGNTNEDGSICVHNRHIFEEHGCKFMPFEEAIHFGKEAPLPENEGIDTFLFHKYG